jgi:hypothetical protein
VERGHRWRGPHPRPVVAATSMRSYGSATEREEREPVATDHSDQLQQYRAKLADVKEYL